jgi:hypothetical protein
VGTTTPVQLSISTPTTLDVVVDGLIARSAIFVKSRNDPTHGVNPPIVVTPERNPLRLGQSAVMNGEGNPESIG